MEKNMFHNDSSYHQPWILGPLDPRISDVFFTESLLTYVYDIYLGLIYPLIFEKSALLPCTQNRSAYADEIMKERTKNGKNKRFIRSRYFAKACPVKNAWITSRKGQFVIFEMTYNSLLTHTI